MKLNLSSMYHFIIKKLVRCISWLSVSVKVAFTPVQTLALADGVFYSMSDDYDDDGDDDMDDEDDDDEDYGSDDDEEEFE